MKSFEVACRWVRKSCPAPVVVELLDSEVVFGKTAALAALRQDWTPVLCGPASPASEVARFRQVYEPFVGHHDPFELPTLTVPDLQKAARKARRTAAGCDGWSASLLLQLPDLAWEDLCDCCSDVSRKPVGPKVCCTGGWSTSLRRMVLDLHPL